MSYLAYIDMAVGLSVFVSVGILGAMYFRPSNGMDASDHWWNLKWPKTKSKKSRYLSTIKNGSEYDVASAEKKGSWERSKAKSELGYYHAHQSKLPNDGIASHEYEMNKPKPLGVTTNVSRIPTKINRYSYEDLDNEVRLDFKQDGWDWSLIDTSQITTDWGNTSVRLTIDSPKYGLYIAAFNDLYSEISGVAVRKMKSKVRLILTKKAIKSWPRLQGLGIPVNSDGTLLHELSVD